MAGLLNLNRPSARPRPDADKFFWPDTRQRIDSGAVTPILSDQVAASLFAVEAGQLAQAYARDIASPLPEYDNHNLARVAQYHSIHLENPYEAKRHYVDILKLYLLGKIENESDVNNDILPPHSVEEYMDDAFRASHDLARIASNFGYPRVADVTQNPLRLLADMPLPVYLTTSHNKFLEEAIASTGHRKPVSEIFYWHDGLKRIKSIFQTEPDYDPHNVKYQDRPLVYHLFGLADYPESIVLTEDDHLDYLVKLSTLMHEVKHAGKSHDLPTCVSMALSGATLLLLGYDVYQWDFRIIFKGLIQPTAESRKNRLPPGRAMQIEPGVDEQQKAAIKSYLDKFFGEAHFEIFWGDLAKCVYTLWALWKGQTPP